MDFSKITDKELIEIYQNIDEFLKFLDKAKHTEE